MDEELDSAAYKTTGTIVVNPDLRSTTLGAVIKMTRHDKKLNLRELAKQVGCSHVFLSKVELGRKVPSEELLAKIQCALGIRRIIIPRGNGFFESSSLADLIYPELLLARLSSAQRKAAGLILSTLRRAGQKLEVQTPSAVDSKRGIRAILQVTAANDEQFHITITDSNE